jgi:hypothetical protein
MPVKSRKTGKGKNEQRAKQIVITHGKNMQANTWPYF